MATTNTTTKGNKMTVAQIFEREAQRVATLTNAPGKQVNGITQREYQGFNRINLYLTAKENGFESKEWLTHDQFTKAGYTLKEDQHGIPVFNYKIIETDGKKEKVLRYYLVFNKDQLELSKEAQKEAEEAF